MEWPGNDLTRTGSPQQGNDLRRGALAFGDAAQAALSNPAVRMSRRPESSPARILCQWTPVSIEQLDFVASVTAEWPARLVQVNPLLRRRAGAAADFSEKALDLPPFSWYQLCRSEGHRHSAVWYPASAHTRSGLRDAVTESQVRAARLASCRGAGGRPSSSPTSRPSTTSPEVPRTDPARSQESRRGAKLAWAQRWLRAVKARLGNLVRTGVAYCRRAARPTPVSQPRGPRRCSDCEDESACTLRVFAVSHQATVAVLDRTMLADALHGIKDTPPQEMPKVA